MNVERLNGQMDEYPTATSYLVEDGVLYLSVHKDEMLAVYAKGQWIRVVNTDHVETP